MTREKLQLIFSGEFSLKLHDHYHVENLSSKAVFRGRTWNTQCCSFSRQRFRKPSRLDYLLVGDDRPISLRLFSTDTRLEMLWFLSEFVI